MSGNEALWVALSPPGEVVPQPDGSLARKFMWWRLVPGALGLQARRLDRPAPPARVDVPEGYGSGAGFQATGVTFPTEGCWEVTGRVGGRELRFVVSVRRPSSG